MLHCERLKLAGNWRTGQDRGSGVVSDSIRLPRSASDEREWWRGPALGEASSLQLTNVLHCGALSAEGNHGLHGAVGVGAGHHIHCLST